MGKLVNAKCKFSIICPVYNAGNYLKTAIESVLYQSYIFWELILIDDGSTDGSSDLCDEYAKKDQRIRVIHVKNQGVSAARNVGIKLACGEWILFMDSDDYFEKNALYILNDSMVDEEIDMIIFNHYVDVEDKSYKHTIELANNFKYNRNYIESRILPGMLNICDLKKEKQIDVLPFVWNKAYRREILEGHKIMFYEELEIWEDKIFWLLYMKNIKNILFVDCALYHYVQAKKERLSGKYVPEIFRNVVMIYNIMKENFENLYDMETYYSNEYYYKVIMNLIERSAERNNYKVFSIIIKENLCIPQIKKWVLNVAPEKCRRDVKNRNYDVIARRFYFQIKLKNGIMRINEVAKNTLYLLVRRLKSGVNR